MEILLKSSKRSLHDLVLDSVSRSCGDPSEILHDLERALVRRS